jgi:protein-L-isoaspartate O-methyltransferase
VEECNAPDSDEARRKYRRLAAVYDRRIRFVAPIRRRVIDLLCLQPGEHVLDMGCGTGASFAALREAVGQTGRVTGVELSEEMAAVARTRIADQRMALPVNLIVKAIAGRYVTTCEGFDAPWSHLAESVPDLLVRRALEGGVYIASGRISREAD